MGGHEEVHFVIKAVLNEDAVKAEVVFSKASIVAEIQMKRINILTVVVAFLTLDLAVDNGKLVVVVNRVVYAKQHQEGMVPDVIIAHSPALIPRKVFIRGMVASQES